MSVTGLRIFASLLFVPGDREGAIARAWSTDADMLCIDLEDGVRLAAKADARERVAAMLGGGALARHAVRINALGTREGLRDLLMLAEAPHRPGTLVIPKVDGVTSVVLATSVLGENAGSFLPMIESADGVANAPAIAAHSLCGGLLFGGADLAGEIGVSPSREALAAARGMLVLACVRAGRPAYDMPCLELADAEAVAAEARHARALGFAGKAAIHPSQLAALNAVFRASPEEVAAARRALDAFAASGGGAGRLDGGMIDAAVMRRHRKLVGTVDEASPTEGGCP
jgi:(S)-citramalyl-CoA lyase